MRTDTPEEQEIVGAFPVNMRLKLRGPLVTVSLAAFSGELKQRLGRVFVMVDTSTSRAPDLAMTWVISRLAETM
jgi:hypothetical protein